MDEHCQDVDGACQECDDDAWQCARMNEIAANAKAARLRAGFTTHEAAAKKIGCSRTLVLAWESGATPTRGSKYLLRAARAYQVRPEWLADNDGVDGFPWDGARTTTAPPVPSEATLESLDTRIRALDTALAGLARVLAATIPTVGRAFEAEIAGLPDDLLAQRLVSVLLKTVQQENAQNDILQQASKATKRNRP